MEREERLGHVIAYFQATGMAEGGTCVQLNCKAWVYEDRVFWQLQDFFSVMFENLKNAKLCEYLRKHHDQITEVFTAFSISVAGELLPSRQVLVANNQLHYASEYTREEYLISSRGLLCLLLWWRTQRWQLQDRRCATAMLHAFLTSATNHQIAAPNNVVAVVGMHTTQCDESSIDGKCIHIRESFDMYRNRPGDTPCHNLVELMVALMWQHGTCNSCRAGLAQLLEYVSDGIRPVFWP